MTKETNNDDDGCRVRPGRKTNKGILKRWCNIKMIDYSLQIIYSAMLKHTVKKLATRTEKGVVYIELDYLYRYADGYISPTTVFVEMNGMKSILSMKTPSVSFTI